MKILHVPFTYWPDPSGGTEVYVRHLCEALAPLGMTSVVAAPAASDRTTIHEGVTVHRFRGGVADLDNVYGEPQPDAVAAFSRVLEDVRPDVLHQHALSPACSVDLMHAAHARGIAVVFTYHTPAVSCQRGTLLRWGSEVCDGILDTAPCTACVLQQHGVATPVGELLGALPPSVGRWLGEQGRSGGVWTAARMSSLMETRHRGIRDLFRTPEVVVALCSWTEDLLRANGVATDHIVRVPHGLPAHEDRSRRHGRDETRSLRLACLGRLHPTKGVDVLIAALERNPDVPLTLDVIGVSQGEASNDYQRELIALAGRDMRIRFLSAWPSVEVVDRLSSYDALAVPSQWLETGPLVALEAFAAGIPVVGSKLGGVADQVRDGIDGLLVSPFDSVDAWSRALNALAQPGAIDALRRGVRPPRRMDDVAREMARAYAQAARRFANRTQHPAPSTQHPVSGTQHPAVPS